MMQPATGMVPHPMLSVSTDQQQHPGHHPQPFPPFSQQQQQWMMMPQQQLQPSEPQHQTFQLPPIWNQPAPAAAVPPPQQPPLVQPQFVQPQAQLQAQLQGSGADDIRSLWIGDLQYWMDENYLYGCFAHTGEVVSVKIIRNKQNAQSEGYGFIEFVTHAAAERVLQTYNGTLMPNAEQNFRLNWATLGAGEKRKDDTPDYTIFVGDLASDVTDYMLLETFKGRYQSIKGSKIVTDKITGRSKGYGFVRFGDESEQLRAMTEMNGVFCSIRPMRIGPAASKKPTGGQQYTAGLSSAASHQNPQSTPGESDDPNNTTIFVGGLDPSVSDAHLRQVFGQFGELVHVKIPVGKRCGFVQFTNRICAEQALSLLNGTVLGGQSIRLSWGHSLANKQAQPDRSQWNEGYYGYPQGYEPYGYTSSAAAAPQDPNMYYAAGYSGYGNYPQPQQLQ